MSRKEDLKVFSSAARMLKAVAHPIRIEIINHLVQTKSLSVNEIKEKVQITQSMTSQHLAQLRNAGVLGWTKEANVCYYYILNKNVLKLLDCVGRCARDGEGNHV